MSMCTDDGWIRSTWFCSAYAVERCHTDASRCFFSLPLSILWCDFWPVSLRQVFVCAGKIGMKWNGIWLLRITWVASHAPRHLHVRFWFLSQLSQPRQTRQACLDAALPGSDPDPRPPKSDAWAHCLGQAALPGHQTNKPWIWHC